MQALSLHPCISQDALTGAISLILADEFGGVRHAAIVASSLSIRATYLIIRRSIPGLPEWDEIGSLMIRQYNHLLPSLQQQIQVCES